jgi:DNA-binding MurR/RpiR family transcriptional regulator
VSVSRPAAARSLQQRVAELADRLAPAERRVAEHVRDHPHEVAFASAGDIGERTGSSDATVIRTAKALGYTGLPELKHAVGTAIAELVQASAMLRQRLETVRHQADHALQRVASETAELAQETGRTVALDAFERAVAVLAAAREVMTFGVGPSGLVAEYLALRLNRLGARARAATATGFRLADALLPLQAGDAVVLVAPARLVRELEVIIDRAEEVDARVVLVTDTLAPVLGTRVEVSLPAALSPSGVVGEALSAIIIADALALGLALDDEPRTIARSETLNRLRTAIAGAGADEPPPPRSRDTA